MKNKELNIALIGCGYRARGLLKYWVDAAPGQVRITQVYDTDPESIQRTRDFWPDFNFHQAKTLEEAVSAPEVNLVAIFTPNRYHCEAILAALAAGKQVFSEKPLATTQEDCNRIIEAEKRAGIKIMTGFVLRYAPIYRKVKELLDSGTFGYIINISANENRSSGGGGASMSSTHGWRRLTSEGGPYLLEKCCHDLDIFNWYAGCTPTRVASFCGRDYFIPKNEALYDKLGHETFTSWIPYKDWMINPFTSPKDIFDNHTVILEYPNGIKLNFQLTLANAISERRMFISCSEGTIILEANSGLIRYKRYLDKYETSLQFYGSAGHYGADETMSKELVSSLLEGKNYSCSGSVNGMACARVALAANESALTGRIVKIEDNISK